jgi:F-type H+-transporting ATPase subunit b
VRVGWAAVATSFALLLSGPARAAEDEGGAGELLWMALNLVLLLGVLVYFARKPLRAFFADRRHRIQDELQDAERLRSEVEERLGSWQRKLAAIDQETERLRSRTLDQARAEAERVITDAQATAARIQRDAQAMIEQELRRSQAALRAEAGELTVRLAGDLLGRHITDADHERLLDEFIADVERSARAAGNGAER